MRTNYLFPNRFKLPGWFLLGLGIVLGFVYIFFQESPGFLNQKVFAMVDQEFLHPVILFQMVQTNLFGDIIAILLISGGLFVAFSKEKIEDEYISKIRLESLVWATYINYFVIIFSIIFIYGTAFLWILIFNMFTLLFFFIIRFYWLKKSVKKMMRNEE